MNPLPFDRLRPIGLTPAIAQRLLPLLDGPEVEQRAAARVIEVHRETVVLHDGERAFDARPHPRLLLDLRAAGDALAVGDWVVHADDFGARRVVACAEPINRMTRRDADGVHHVLVANADTAFLVMGLDGDFNPRRLERWLVLVEGTGHGSIAPVVVLTKADIAADAAGACELLRARLASTVPLYAVNALDPAAAALLAPHVAAGQTAVLLGSSGAGKSTLTNTLLGIHAQDTGPVRAADSRGRHTTTARSLHRLPAVNGSPSGCLIDTPGLRTLRADADASAFATVFADIDALAADCRFRDCTHSGEPGCAVAGAVSADRLRNWHKLRRDLRRDTLTPLEKQQQLAVWKARMRAGRARSKMKRES